MNPIIACQSICTKQTYSAPSALSTYQIRRFQKRVYDYYRHNGRDLPWRKTTDPYAILVSEVMLQQTQVVRVIGKYTQFIQRFPDIRSLARASLRDILSAWQGLGYNRRALALKRLAEIIVSHYGGKVPEDIKGLKALPGIGDVTASAICAFAFNEPAIFIETNIRAVYIHHFFRGQTEIKDAQIRPLVVLTLDTDNPRLWYYALMDYGVVLKREHSNPSRRSAHYLRQGSFDGSNRQIRGAILRVLIEQPRIAEEMLLSELPFPVEGVKENLSHLVREGLVVNEGGHFSIA